MCIFSFVKFVDSLTRFARRGTIQRSICLPAQNGSHHYVTGPHPAKNNSVIFQFFQNFDWSEYLDCYVGWVGGLPNYCFVYVMQSRGRILKASPLNPQAYIYRIILQLSDLSSKIRG